MSVPLCFKIFLLKYIYIYKKKKKKKVIRQQAILHFQFLDPVKIAEFKAIFTTQDRFRSDNYFFESLIKNVS